jgi:hypothetical protein
MEALEIRLQKRMNASIYALAVLTTLLGLSIVLESCKEKREVNLKTNYDTGIALTVKVH